MTCLSSGTSLPSSETQALNRKRASWRLGGWRERSGIVVVVVLYNVFKRPNGCIGRPSLCPGRPSYIEKRQERRKRGNVGTGGKCLPEITKVLCGLCLEKEEREEKSYVVHRRHG